MAGSPGDCIWFGTLTQALPPSIRVIMQVLAFTLNNAYAALCKPVLFRKALGFLNLLGAHALGHFWPGLLIGHNYVLLR